MDARYFVGVDLHKQSFDFVVMDESGSVQSRGKRSTEEKTVCEFACQLTGQHHLVLEPVVNSHWFLDHVTPFAGSVHIAHPYKVRLIAQSRTKSDRYDATILADLLRVGYLPEAYNPPKEILEIRYLVAHRIRLVRDSVRVKNQVLHLLAREGRQVPYRDRFGVKGREWFISPGISCFALYRLVRFKAVFCSCSGATAKKTNAEDDLHAKCPAGARHSHHCCVAFP